MGIRSRRKGSRVELEIVRLLQEHAIAAEKISRMYRRGPDCSFPLLGRDRTIEVKARRNGFTELYRWIEPADFLVIKANHKKPLLVMRLAEAAQLAAILERTK
jgi:hypothetical protein